MLFIYVESFFFGVAAAICASHIVRRQQRQQQWYDECDGNGGGGVGGDKISHVDDKMQKRWIHKSIVTVFWEIWKCVTICEWITNSIFHSFALFWFCSCFARLPFFSHFHFAVFGCCFYWHQYRIVPVFCTTVVNVYSMNIFQSYRIYSVINSMKKNRDILSCINPRGVATMIVAATSFSCTGPSTNEPTC